MAAAGRDAAEAGAEEFGMFDGGTGRPAPLPDLDGFPAPGAAVAAAAAVRHQARRRGRFPPALRATGTYSWASNRRCPTGDAWRGSDRLLSRLGNCGGGEARAAALTARGWIEWCRGRGSFADALFGAAAAEQPGYRLAELLDELARRGTLCGWARRKEAAWQKFDPDAA